MKSAPQAGIYIAQPLAPTRYPSCALPGGDRTWDVFKLDSNQNLRLVLREVGPFKTAYFARLAAATELHVEPSLLRARLAEPRKKGKP